MVAPCLWKRAPTDCRLSSGTRLYFRVMPLLSQCGGAFLDKPEQFLTRPKKRRTVIGKFYWKSTLLGNHFLESRESLSESPFLVYPVFHGLFFSKIWVEIWYSFLTAEAFFMICKQQLHCNLQFYLLLIK